jgi:uncharacterized coiled-coil protein SlyX
VTDNELILEQFRLFRSEVQTLRTEMREGFSEVRQRLAMLELGLAGVRQDVALLSSTIAGQDVRFDRLSERVERIERRLELS